jgi:hypothetical protein
VGGRPPVEPPARPQEAAASRPLEVAPRRAETPSTSPPTQPDAPARENETRLDGDLRALEDQALRQIDVVAILGAAGIDADALEARPDGDDVLRHIAADELLTRSVMRDMLTNTIYPYGYPREQALADARAAADRMIAAMSPEARAALLETALADGSSAEPELAFYGPDSGRVFTAGGPPTN